MPDPILGLLSFLGLGVYSVFGGLVGTVTVWFFDNHDSKSYRYKQNTKELANREYDGNVAGIVFWFAAALWPATLALEIVAALGAAIVAGPVWLASHVSSYVASAQLKEGGV